MCSPTDLFQKDGLQEQKTAAATANIRHLPTDRITNSPQEMVMHRQQADTSTGVSSFLKPLLLVSSISVFVLEFSLWFPFVIPGVSTAASETYIPAWYHYDKEHTRFDNTPWTYVTDYLLTAIMSCLAICCLRASAPYDCPARQTKDRSSLRLRLYSASLLVCYGISTLAGGWAHQRFTTLESLNTTCFRALWYLCVGNVSFASCYMGLIGREVQKVFGVEGAVPLGPWWFWPAYGFYMAVATGLGYISFKRPACDIFIAGITQFPTTFYCLGALGLRKWPLLLSSRKAEIDIGGTSGSPIALVRPVYRAVYHVGFIGNAPLLPMYPLLVQYSGISLAGINTLLHMWLMITWGLQGISLLHLCRAMSFYTPKTLKD